VALRVYRNNANPCVEGKVHADFVSESLDRFP